MAFFKSGMILVFQHYITFFQLTIFKHTFLLGVLCVYYHADKNLQYVIIAAQQYSNYNFHFLISGELLFWSRLDFSDQRRNRKLNNIQETKHLCAAECRYYFPLKTIKLQHFLKNRINCNWPGKAAAHFINALLGEVNLE